MAQTLDEFLQEARDELVSFEKMWRQEHEKNPEVYPMKMTDGNEGLWWEFLRTDDGPDAAVHRRGPDGKD